VCDTAAAPGQSACRDGGPSPGSPERAGGRGLRHARTSPGRGQAILAVGRAGVPVPLRPGDWQEGATATVSVLDRRGTRGGTGSLGQMPESGQTTWTAPLTALLHAILRPGESQRRRLGSGSEDGAHASDDSHSVLNTLPAPPRPGWQRTWRHIVDNSPACLYIPQLAEALLGAAPKGRAWAPQLRQPRQPTSDGIIRV
jgi:hypothetical protein